MLCKDGIRVKVCHLHLTAAEVRRCAIDTVAVLGCDQAIVALLDNRRQFLVRLSISIAIIQSLSEEQVVVWPDRIVASGSCLTVCIETFIGFCRYFAASKDKVTIRKAVFNIPDIIFFIINYLIFITRRTQIPTFNIMTRLRFIFTRHPVHIVCAVSSLYAVVVTLK